MLEPLRAIPGPVFLLAFWALVVLAVLLGRGRILGRRAGAPPLHATGLAPTSLAVLRGGVLGVIEMAVCRLWTEGLLLVDESAERPTFRTADTAPPVADPVERRILNACRSAQPISQLVLEHGKAVDGLLAREYEELESLGLLYGPRARARARNTFWAGLAMLWAIGGAKLYLGLTHDKPVGFLIASLVIAPFVLLVGIAPWRRMRLTATGRRFFADSRERLDWMRAPEAERGDAERTAGAPLHANATTGLALFGASAFVASAVADPYRRSLQGGSVTSDAGFSSSAGYDSLSSMGVDGGSSASDSGSSDGGSSDGGGDGGGGGCGGCGGD